MSGVAGIVFWDGRQVEPGAIEAMTAAMRHRGPDGITHWRDGSVALGQCMLRTTPESLEENLPLTSDDGNLVLVMDGRVDNAPELRRALAARGAVLRSRADAELVLRAYEAWGEGCTDHIVGECVFLIWDVKRRSLFAGRDAAGTRHFYYHADRHGFAFASEIKGLLTLPGIERRVNDSRVLDYLVPAFDREDQVGTFWQGILRLPAGHAMRITARGPETWRWWNPAELEARRFASMAECTEAFMAQLQEVVRCRLRHIRPVGAMLSGGMDSSTIVGLVSHRLRGELAQPLHTVSLVREDREHCTDWRSIHAILQADPWLQPTVMTAEKVDQEWDRIEQAISGADDPFVMANGLPYLMSYLAGARAGCGTVLDGMAGDLLFYEGAGTWLDMVRRRRWDLIPGLRQACRHHGWGNPWWNLAVTAVRTSVPMWLRARVRHWQDQRRLSAGDLSHVHRELAAPYLASRRSASFLRGETSWSANDQARHARLFMSGQASFAHENYGFLAFWCGVEPRSPYSDRRMIEFGIRMPLEAKIAIPWYKHVMREGTSGMLPEATRWRADIGNHPGWTFYERMLRRSTRDESGKDLPATGGHRLAPWLRRAGTGPQLDRLSECLLVRWLDEHTDSVAQKTGNL